MDFLEKNNEKKNENLIPSLIRSSQRFLTGKNGIESLRNSVKLKEKFGLYNHYVHDEITKCFERKFDLFAENFLKFGKNHAASIMEVEFL